MNDAPLGPGKRLELTTGGVMTYKDSAINGRFGLVAGSPITTESFVADHPVNF